MSAAFLHLGLVLLLLLIVRTRASGYQREYVKVDFEAYDFVNATVCCAECDSSGQQCHVLPDEPLASPCLVEIPRPEDYRLSRGPPRAQAFRALPLDHDLPDRFMISWLAQTRGPDRAAKLGMRFFDFATCQQDGPTELVQQDDEEFALLFVNGLDDGPVRYRISLEEYRRCGRPRCHATVIKEFQPMPLWRHRSRSSSKKNSDDL
ncbi:unnamed protein product [Trichogramma brassicae]|uniref:Laminin N-terminal domain-containing protein n=1 Tax=Trichogramma brassicae TaxID=86971 RepID=A0A6H5IKD6_9HYME|nr:unnamed protein product [Trichogramma brassicae]